MGKTSTEVKQRWMNINYSRYVVSFRYDSDPQIIDYIEEHKGEKGTSQIFREAMAMYINAQKK